MIGGQICMHAVNIILKDDKHVVCVWNGINGDVLWEWVCGVCGVLYAYLSICFFCVCV